MAPAGVAILARALLACAEAENEIELVNYPGKAGHILGKQLAEGMIRAAAGKAA